MLLIKEYLIDTKKNEGAQQFKSIRYLDLQLQSFFYP
jgi:hypothetical protein